MERRKLGQTGLEVSLLGFGGSEIGDSSVDQATVERLLNAALDAGLNVIDTGECYGQSEEKIGRAVAHRRAEFHLFTKCGHTSGLEGQDWEPGMLERSIGRSLQRLKTDRLDLIQLHSCDEATLRKGDAIDVLVRARDAGKVRWVGYSGDNAPANYAVACGAFDVLQTSINIADQLGLDEWVKAASERGMGIIAKRPIANAAWKHDLPEEAYGYEYSVRLKALAYPFLRKENDVQTALSFTATVPGVDTMIVGTKNPARWAENAALLESGDLSQEEYDAIRGRWRAVSQSWTARS
ncbi:aldo/keto reductase [soil metagenome]